MLIFQGLLPNRKERNLIFGAAMSVVCRLFSAWTFYKDRRFKQYLHRTLRYINEQKAFRTGILTNKGNLLSLAEITLANFKEIKEDFHNLQESTSRKFDQYLTSVLHSYADTLFYRNYLFFYTNVIHKLHHDLNLINNKIERAKTNLYMKCRSLVSGLHILADSRIPESILHADTHANTLLSTTNELQHDNRYSLLYGNEVNAYYNRSWLEAS